MAHTYNTSKSTTQYLNRGVLPIKRMQINLQHKTTATSNIFQLVDQLNIDIVVIQEPHIIYNRLIGIPKQYRTLLSTLGRSRTAVVVTNAAIDAILVKQISEADVTAVEITRGNMSFIAASLYLELETHVDIEVEKIGKKKKTN